MKLLARLRYMSRNMTTDIKQEIITQTVHAVPSGALLGTVLANVTINQWQAGIAIAFILLQAVYLIWKWIKEVRRDRQ